MKQISATEFSRTPGATLDAAMREGMVAVIRHRRLVALLSRDPVDLPTTLPVTTITASYLWANLSAILDETENDRQAYIITRNEREVAWLLPRCMLRELGMEL